MTHPDRSTLKALALAAKVDTDQWCSGADGGWVSTPATFALSEAVGLLPDFVLALLAEIEDKSRVAELWIKSVNTCSVALHQRDVAREDRDILTTQLTESHAREAALRAQIAELAEWLTNDPGTGDTHCGWRFWYHGDAGDVLAKMRDLGLVPNPQNP